MLSLALGEPRQVIIFSFSSFLFYLFEILIKTEFDIARVTTMLLRTNNNYFILFCFD